MTMDKFNIIPKTQLMSFASFPSSARFVGGFNPSGFVNVNPQILFFLSGLVNPQILFTLSGFVNPQILFTLSGLVKNLVLTTTNRALFPRHIIKSLDSWQVWDLSFELDLRL